MKTGVRGKLVRAQLTVSRVAERSFSSEAGKED